MRDIVMPRLSDTMQEGTVLRWLKGDGEHISRGEELVEIETDKASMVYESDQDGTLQILAAEGDTLAVGEPIAHVNDDGQADVGAKPQREAVAYRSEASSQARVRASPLARRLASEQGVDLLTLTGSGPAGRIVKDDVQRAAAASGGVTDRAPASADAAQSAQQPPAEAPGADGPLATAKGESTSVELSRTQQLIARRMAESKATIPHFSLQLDVDMEDCVSLRMQLREISEPTVPTYNDMVLKACALALREHPRANSTYRDGHLKLHSRVNVGVAVAAADALVVPTVFDADIKSLGEIAKETGALAERVRAGVITPPELSGGTFTVSNLGMYGIRSFTAIINPPQAAILSVGALQPRAVARGQQLAIAHMLTLTLACDHRVLYGADAAEFLGRIRELLERPASLTL
jgi:pyruvate dehydrogenase E2 component (dihydrolipoamide acetyltransferase)